MRGGRLARDQSGQALVEFVLVLPLLLLVLFGIMQFGLLFYKDIDITSATREGARKASISRDTSCKTAVVNAIAAATGPGIDDGKTVIDVSPATCPAGQDVTVNVTYPYSMNVLGMVVWSGPMRAKAVVRVE